MSLVEPPVQSSAQSGAQSSAQHGTHSGVQSGVIPTRSHLILIIDDETVGIEVRRMLLERAGYRVLTALDGTTGIGLFAEQPVEAVVLDFAMPGMNGGEVARTLRSIKPRVPILMLSAYTSLPPEIAGLVDLSMTKGEGAPSLLKKLSSLLPAGTSPAEHARPPETAREPQDASDRK